MAISFIHSAKIGLLTRNKLMFLVCSLIKMGLEPKYISEVNSRQTNDLLGSDIFSIVETITVKFSEGRQKKYEQVFFVTSFTYQGRRVDFFWILDAKTNNLEISLLYANEWRRDFESNWEKDVQDSARYAQFFLQLIHTLVMVEYEIACDWRYLPENLPKNCIAIGSWSQGFRYVPGIISENIDKISCTASFDDQYPKQIKSQYEIESYLETKYPDKIAELYIWHHGMYARFVIDFREGTSFYFYPLAPFKINMFENEVGLDLQSYISLFLNLCNGFIVYELRTNIEPLKIENT